MAHQHPLSIVIDDIVSIFGEMGFSVVLGPEIEDEYYNFDALNIPAHHPARDMWDTFWLKQTNNQQSAADDGLAGGKDSKSSVVGSKLLRTHTSPVQVRFAEKNKPPIRIIVPG